jgi:hypothetical protein
MPGIHNQHVPAERSLRSSPATMPMPSPTWSLSTLDSTVLITPSMPFLELPAMNAAGTQLHQALAYRPGLRLPIAYDAVLDPSTIRGSGIDDTTLRQLLGQGATNKAGPVILRCDVSSVYSFYITVHPGTVVGPESPYVDRTIPLPPTDPRAPMAPATRGSFVTVHNLLVAIHLALNRPVSPAEFDSHPNLKDGVYRAMLARCERDPAELRQPKCVDYFTALGVGTRVLGLAGTKEGSHWALNFR